MTADTEASELVERLRALSAELEPAGCPTTKQRRQIDTVDEAADRITQLEQVAREAREALASASEQFDFYAKSHKAKGTKEAHLKAAVNLGWSMHLDELAARIDALLEPRT